MKKTIILILAPVLLSLAACEEENPAYDTLLPLISGSTFNYDSDSDDDTWFINVKDGAGKDGEPSWDYTLMVRDSLGHETPNDIHDLYVGEDGYTEVAPAETAPELYLKMPPAEGDVWEEIIPQSTTQYFYDFEYEDREDVTVPAGTFEDAWVKYQTRLLQTNNDSWETKTRDWYVVGVGLVQRVITSSEGEDTTLTLTDYEFPEE